MLYRLLVCAATVTLAVGMGYAGESNLNVNTSGKRIAPTDANGMFAHYCTPCHGVDGKGHGPIVIEHKAPPVDLTVLNKNNHGKFPEAHVEKVLLYGVNIPSHTSVEMPVWGPILGKINQSDPKDKELRISALSHYLETIQMK